MLDPDFVLDEAKFLNYFRMTSESVGIWLTCTCWDSVYRRRVRRVHRWVVSSHWPYGKIFLSENSSHNSRTPFRPVRVRVDVTRVTIWTVISVRVVRSSVPSAALQSAPIRSVSTTKCVRTIRLMSSKTALRSVLHWNTWKPKLAQTGRMSDPTVDIALNA
jgi:hypothetical protein